MQESSSLYEEFNCLTNQLSSIVYLNKSSHSKSLLQKLLNQFNDLRYSENSVIANEKAVLVLNQCCSLIPHNDEHTALLLLTLFINFLTKLKISIEGKTLDVSIDWILKCTGSNSQQQVKLALLALQAVVRGKTSLIEDKLEKIVEVCQTFVNSNEKVDAEIYLNSLLCLEALCFISDSHHKVQKQTLEKCIRTFLHVLYEKPFVKDARHHCNILIACIRALGNLVTNQVPSIFEFLPELFGICKNYILFGLPNHSGTSFTKVKPSNIILPADSNDTHHHHPRTFGKYDKKSKKKVPTPISQMANGEVEEMDSSYTNTMPRLNLNYTITSESEISDVEGAASNTCTPRMSAKIRRCTISLLGSLLLEGDPKNLIQYLPSLLPDDTHPSQDITACLMSDTSAACRCEMLVVLSIIFRKFKNYFQLADVAAQSSFTSLSNVIAESIKKLHRCLNHILSVENYKGVIIQVLKSISDLIRSTPYHKMGSTDGLLTLLAKQVAPFVDNSDINVQIPALVVFGCIASIEPKIEEANKITWGDLDYNQIKRPWLLDKCIKILVEKKGVNVALGLECLQVVAALVRNYPQRVVVPYQNELANIIHLSSPNYDFMLRLYTGKLLESIATSLQSTISSSDENESNSVAAVAKVWEALLLPSLTNLLKCENEPSLRTIGCNCLTNVGVHDSAADPSIIFDELTRKNQILCITHVFGYLRDEDPAVRGAAIRALATFVTFKNLRGDPLFLGDAIDAFFGAAEDKNMNVSFQTSWLFAHLADSILANGKDEEEEEPLTHDQLVRLLKTGIVLANNSKKGRPYTVRGLAVLMSLSTEAFLLDQGNIIREAVNCLVTTASTGNAVKVRWNACYAIGTAFCNKWVCIETRSLAFPVLLQLVTSSKNFKVRIGAAHALSSVVDKSAYDEYYFVTWKSLLESLDNCQSIADLTEYQHRDQLIDTICCGLCHLLSLGDSQDIVNFQKLTMPYFEVLQQQFNRFKNRIVPEKATALLAASANLSQIKETSFKNDCQRKAYLFISQIFSVTDFDI